MERSSFRYFFPLSVRYNEVDAQGIVFNAHYLTWYDMAVSAYIRAAGWDNRAEIKASGADFHVVRALVEYLCAPWSNIRSASAMMRNWRLACAPRGLALLL